MRQVVLAVLGLLLGIAFGSTYANRSIRQHAPQLAVMWLADFHSQALQASVQAKDCLAAAQRVARLHDVADQIALVFPKAVAQEAVFRRDLERLQQLTLPKAAAPGACAYDVELSKHIEAACDDCHREYR